MDNQYVNTPKSTKKRALIFISIWIVWFLTFGPKFAILYTKIWGISLFEYSGWVPSWGYTNKNFTLSGFIFILVINIILGLIVFIVYKISKFISNNIFRVNEKPENYRASFVVVLVIIIGFIILMHSIPQMIVNYAEKNNCNLVFDGQSFKNRQECLVKLGINKSDGSICNKITESYTKDLCFYDIAQKTSDAKLCNLLVAREPTECVEKISRNLNDGGLCNTLQNEEFKTICFLKNSDISSQKITLSMCQSINKYKGYKYECLLKQAVDDQDKKYCEYIKEDIDLEYEKCVAESEVDKYHGSIQDCENIQKRTTLEKYAGCLNSFK